MIIQLTGMSGAGKSTLSYSVKDALEKLGIKVEVLDGDDYRQFVFKELGFSREDRNDNIRRLAFVADKFSKHGIVAIICAINPYENIREELKSTYDQLLTVHVNCDLQTLIARDTKGLYRKALLPDGHEEKIYNLTGVNDPFDIPEHSDLQINTHTETLHESTQRFIRFIQSRLTGPAPR